MDGELVERVLGRKERPLPSSSSLIELKENRSRILLTGGQGSLGIETAKFLADYEVMHLSTDIDSCDVTNLNECKEVVASFQPTHILHLAADKHAPVGEIQPQDTLLVNSIGTLNIAIASKMCEATLVLASTCKACDPETVYGASKLIAERIVLNQGGSVARFFNVIETAGNVFEAWSKLPEDDPIPATPCYRYFISKAEATSLLIRVLALSKSKQGRYIVDPGSPQYVLDVANRLFPGREIKLSEPRRGDRVTEPLKASSENLKSLGDGLMQVVSTHDVIGK